MARSSVQDILAAQRAVQSLDKKGRLAILKDLIAQKSDTVKDTTPVKKMPVIYKEEGEQ